MGEIRKITLDEFHAELKAQGVKAREDYAFRCPMCGVVQSARDLIAAGAGKDFDEVEHYLGFSCFGRWTCAPSPRNEQDGKPCDWTLGGLFSCHKLAVVVDGREIPAFEPATPEEAQAHALTNC